LRGEWQIYYASTQEKSLEGLAIIKLILSKFDSLFAFQNPHEKIS
jgi:hypothetical protein